MSELRAELPPAPHIEENLELIELLGAGGMGQVWRVRDRRFGREAALKVLKSALQNTRARARFVREARLMALLDHPGIPPIYEFGRSARDEPFLLMKLIEGGTLGERLDDFLRRGRPPTELPALLRQLAQACEALAYAHGRGVIHRDLKPDNILMGPRGEVYLTDWGVARWQKEAPAADRAYRERVSEDWGEAESALTSEGGVVGSPGYLSPEQAAGGEVSPASDSYALGVILYQLLWGRRPIEARGWQYVAAVMQGAIAFPKSEAPRPLVDLCRACLALDPQLRPDMGAIAAALRLRPERRSRRRGPLAPVVIAAVIAFGIGLAVDRSLRSDAPAPALLAELAASKDEARSWRRRATRSAAELSERTRAFEEAIAELEERERGRAAERALYLEDRLRGLLNRARRAVEERRFADAMSRAQEALELAPESGEAHRCLGDAYAGLDRELEARRSYSRAFELDSGGSAEDFHERARRLMRSGRARQSLSYYDWVVAARDKSPQVYNNRGTALTELGRFDEALKDFNTALALDPEYAKAYQNRGVVHQKAGRLQAALRDIGRAIALDAEQGEFWNSRGVILEATGDLEGALRAYSKAAELEPSMAKAQNNRGALVVKLERYEEALRDFDRALIADPSMAEAYSNRGLVFEELGRKEEALRDLRRALTLNPELRERLAPTIARLEAAQERKR